jgi:deazaflavin-dependent oxidoreductase (nitroreductase family)
MSRQYRVTATVRFVNGVIVFLLRRGMKIPGVSLLTVRGRKSGRPYSIPVELMETDGRRWLVAPYGETNWVRNARAAGTVELASAGRQETVRVREVDARTAAPVLRLYLNRVPIVRPYFDVQPDSPDEAFVAEAHRHPVFLVEPQVNGV